MQAHTLPQAPSRRKLLPFRLLTVLDLAGLLVTSAIVSSLDTDPGATSFHARLFVVGFGVWLLVAQVRSLATILTHSRNHVAWAPLIAGAIVVAMSAVAGDHYTMAGILTFVGCWTAWLVAARILRQRYLPRIRILTFGSPEYLAELRDLPNVDLVVLQAPPEGFEDIDVVALDPVGSRGEDWTRWVTHADMAGVKLIAAPLVVETLTRQLPLEALHGRWAQYLLGGRRPYVEWKRVMDIVLVVTFAPVILLVFALVALAVLLDDGRPVLFWQVRIGQYRKPFRMAKIRSMRLDAEAAGAAFATADDPRITRVGAFLRRFRLDEIPQFWNVLKGEMSIVGPRPEQLQFSEEFEQRFPLYSLRYNLRPGITGWAQVMHGYAADYDQNYGKLRHDLYYVRHVSPLLDLSIVLRTFGVLTSGFGSR